MTKLRHTLKTAADLVEAGLARESAEADIARVADRYAVAVTPAMAELIDASRSQRRRSPASSCPTCASWSIAPGERADPIGDYAKARSKASCIAIPTACS